MSEVSLVCISAPLRQQGHQFFEIQPFTFRRHLVVHHLGNTQIVKHQLPGMLRAFTSKQSLFHTDKRHRYICTNYRTNCFAGVTAESRGNIHSDNGQTTVVDQANRLRKGLANFTIQAGTQQGINYHTCFQTHAITKRFDTDPCLHCVVVG